jgi:hypothetical protein
MYNNWNRFPSNNEQTASAPSNPRQDPWSQGISVQLESPRARFNPQPYTPFRNLSSSKSSDAQAQYTKETVDEKTSKQSHKTAININPPDNFRSPAINDVDNSDRWKGTLFPASPFGNSHDTTIPLTTTGLEEKSPHPPWIRHQQATAPARVAPATMLSKRSGGAVPSLKEQLETPPQIERARQPRFPPSYPATATPSFLDVPSHLRVPDFTQPRNGSYSFSPPEADPAPPPAGKPIIPPIRPYPGRPTEPSNPDRWPASIGGGGVGSVRGGTERGPGLGPAGSGRWPGSGSGSRTETSAVGRQWAISRADEVDEEDEEEAERQGEGMAGGGALRNGLVPAAGAGAVNGDAGGRAYSAGLHRAGGASGASQISFKVARGDDRGGDRWETAREEMLAGGGGGGGSRRDGAPSAHPTAGGEPAQPAARHTPRSARPLLLLPPGRAADEEVWAALLPGEDGADPASAGGTSQKPSRRPGGGGGGFLPESPGLDSSSPRGGGSGSSTNSSPGLNGAEGRSGGGTELAAEDLVRLAAGVALRRRSASPDGTRTPMPESLRRVGTRRPPLLPQMDGELWDLWDEEARRLRHPLVRAERVGEMG